MLEDSKMNIQDIILSKVKSRMLRLKYFTGSDRLLERSTNIRGESSLKWFDGDECTIKLAPGYLLLHFSYNLMINIAEFEDPAFDPTRMINQILHFIRLYIKHKHKERKTTDFYYKELVSMHDKHINKQVSVVEGIGQINYSRSSGIIKRLRDQASGTRAAAIGG